MKSASEFEEILMHREPIDMRKGINGLCELIAREKMGDLMRPTLFVFRGRRRDRIKVLYFDQSGFAMWQKVLEKDKFPWPNKSSESILNINPEQFEWLLSGYDIWKMKAFKKLHFDYVS